MKTQKEIEKEIEEVIKECNYIKTEGEDVMCFEDLYCLKCKEKIDVLKALLQQNKEFIEVIDKIKTKNINDKGLDVETEEYWINEKQLKSSIIGSEEKK